LSEWLDLQRNITNFPVIDALDPLYLDISGRTGTSNTDVIRLLDYSIMNYWDISVIYDCTVVLEAGDSKIIVAPYL
jgi:hypothetical protein